MNYYTKSIVIIFFYNLSLCRKGARRKFDYWSTALCLEYILTHCFKTSLTMLIITRCDLPLIWIGTSWIYYSAQFGSSALAIRDRYLSLSWRIVLGKCSTIPSFSSSHLSKVLFALLLEDHCTWSTGCTPKWAILSVMRAREGNDFITCCSSFFCCCSYRSFSEVCYQLRV